MIKEARKWIGYLEHKNNEQLNLYTVNAGKGGCTIFSLIICRHYRWLNFSGLPWCAVFVHAICIGALGKEKARKLLGIPHAGTKKLARRMKRKGFLEDSEYIPSEGDLIFLHNGDGTISHCGIVENVEEDVVTTIEGNTVDPTGYFEESQGGAVSRRRRKLTDSSIVCYANIHKFI